MNVQIQNLYSGSYHLLDDADNDAMLLRSAVTLNSGDFKSTGCLPLLFNAAPFNDDSSTLSGCPSSENCWQS